MKHPEDHPRRILLAVTGLSPQIVTETVYALAVAPAPPRRPFVPTEVRLITTKEGTERAELSLLHPESGWFHRLRADYALPPIAFESGHIHVLEDAAGRPLDDIRTPADNTRAADTITEVVRELTRDSESALHVSIAGGRKTMGFYLGYALSLYGRAQDRLSHVLVSPTLRIAPTVLLSDHHESGDLHPAPTEPPLRHPRGHGDPGRNPLRASAGRLEPRPDGRGRRASRRWWRRRNGRSRPSGSNSTRATAW